MVLAPGEPKSMDVDSDLTGDCSRLLMLNALLTDAVTDVGGKMHGKMPADVAGDAVGRTVETDGECCGC